MHWRQIVRSCVFSLRCLIAGATWCQEEPVAGVRVVESGVCGRDREHSALPGAVRSRLVPRHGARTQELHSSGKAGLHSCVVSMVRCKIPVIVRTMQIVTKDKVCVFNG